MRNLILGLIYERFFCDIFDLLFDVKCIFIVIDYFINWIKIYLICDLIVVIMIIVFLNGIIDYFDCFFINLFY